MSPKFKKSKDLDLFGFKENKNIFYVNYSDSDQEITAKLKTLLKDEKKLERMTASGYNLVKSKHTNTKRVVDLYNLI